MKLAKKLNIDPVEYAIQGNAILGIKESGKTYTATYIAERLFEAKIPFVALDPTNIWPSLKIGKKGPGLPIVVAGEDGDLPLTPESAPDIVRAAMREGVSLVLDMYSMELSKNDWRKIVASCIRILLYENKPYGLRHIFIEEAAEYIPQVVRPEQGVVYAEIDKLARMGGNASLGYTIINQRPEQINKSVLELCDSLFLHRQKGKHSITGLGKWLDAADVSNAKEITNSLPSLDRGECWVWPAGSHTPVRVKMPEKKTVHPDRRNPLVALKAGGSSADVSQFVERMKKSLSEIPKKESESKKINGPLTMRKLIQAKKQVTEFEPVTVTQNKLSMEDKLRYQIEDLEKRLAEEKRLRADAEKRLAAVKKMLAPQYDQLKKIFEAAGVDGICDTDISAYQKFRNNFDGKHLAMFDLMLEHKRMDRAKWCLLAGIPYTSNWFDKGFSKMKTLGIVVKEGKDFVLKQV